MFAKYIESQANLALSARISTEVSMGCFLTNEIRNICVVFLIEFYNLEIAWVPRSLTCLSVNISVVFRISCFKMHDVLLFLRIVIFVEHLYCQALCKVLSWTISFNFFTVALGHTLDIIIIIIQLGELRVNVSQSPKIIQLTLTQDKIRT